MQANISLPTPQKSHAAFSVEAEGKKMLFAQSSMCLGFMNLEGFMAAANLVCLSISHRVPLGAYASSFHLTTATATSTTSLLMVVEWWRTWSCHFYPYCLPEWVRSFYCLPTLYRLTRWERNFLLPSKAIPCLLFWIYINWPLYEVSLYPRDANIHWWPKQMKWSF